MWDRQPPFAVTDVSYIAFVNKENKLEGIITIQKRARETLEDDIAIGAMLAFHIGNDVQSETAQSFRWCVHVRLPLPAVSGGVSMCVCRCRQTHMDHARLQGRHDT